jgi:transposase InsO family protein
MRHATIEGLTEAIGRYIHYYNTRRIHGTLRLIPRQFAEKKRYPKTLPESGGLPV